MRRGRCARRCCWATTGGARSGRTTGTVVDGRLWKLRTGAPWRDLPERDGPWTSGDDRFGRW
jgi:transposase